MKSLIYLRTITACTWLYVAAVAAVWLLLRLGGDRWWFSTLILFGPRWFLALPLVPLGLLAALARRRLLVPLTAAALAILGPIMGFCIPWARCVAPKGPGIRVLTCNVKGHCKDNAALDELIRATAPDIVALQGCWHQVRVKWPDGWQVAQEGELLIASRYSLRDMRASQDGARRRIFSCVVATPGRDLRFATLHPLSPHQSLLGFLDRRTMVEPSARGSLTQEIQNRWRDAEQAALWCEEDSRSEIIVGDFNLPPDSAIYGRYWTGYRNAFSEAGLGFGFTEWPGFRRRWFGIRIDHILSTKNWRPQRSWVGPNVGSDHLPLIADLSSDQ
jgi:endonuclease/exonuclease/phosphatase (EEP) superfamily protein YafD